MHSRWTDRVVSYVFKRILHSKYKNSYSTERFVCNTPDEVDDYVFKRYDAFFQFGGHALACDYLYILH